MDDWEMGDWKMSIRKQMIVTKEWMCGNCNIMEHDSRNKKASDWVMPGVWMTDN